MIETPAVLTKEGVEAVERVRGSRNKSRVVINGASYESDTIIFNGFVEGKNRKNAVDVPGTLLFCERGDPELRGVNGACADFAKAIFSKVVILPEPAPDVPEEPQGDEVEQ